MSKTWTRPNANQEIHSRELFSYKSIQKVSLFIQIYSIYLIQTMKSINKGIMINEATMAVSNCNELESD